jgi:hypothetical protein
MSPAIAEIPNDRRACEPDAKLAAPPSLPQPKLVNSNSDKTHPTETAIDGRKCSFTTGTVVWEMENLTIP